MTNDITIAEILAQRLTELGIDHKALVKRLGYADINKGLQHLDEMLDGGYSRERAKRLILRLAPALEIEASVVCAAVEAMRLAYFAKCDTEYRRTFRPHGIVVTVRSRPELGQIWVAAITGSERKMRIEIDELSNPDAFSDQIRGKLPDFIPPYGEVIGYVVNYSPDRAVEYDKSGGIVRDSIRLGNSSVSLGRN